MSRGSRRAIRLLAFATVAFMYGPVGCVSISKGVKLPPPETATPPELVHPVDLTLVDAREAPREVGGYMTLSYGGCNASRQYVRLEAEEDVRPWAESVAVSALTKAGFVSRPGAEGAIRVEIRLVEFSYTGGEQFSSWLISRATISARAWVRDKIVLDGWYEGSDRGMRVSVPTLRGALPGRPLATALEEAMSSFASALAHLD